MQHRINDIAAEIDELINSNDNDNKDRFGEEIGRFYNPDIIEKFMEASHCLKQAAEMAQRVDYLVSGDDGEESFRSRWKKEVRGYYKAT